MCVQTVAALREPMGVTVVARAGFPEVGTLSADGPFKKAGVVIGDRLTHINGISIEAKTAQGTTGGRKAWVEASDLLCVCVVCVCVLCVCCVCVARMRACAEALVALAEAEFPKSLTFLRNENSAVDQTIEHPEGFFVVTASRNPR